MKTILIETVSNGWIVTDYEPCRHVVKKPVAVFNDMVELMYALPELLGQPLNRPDDTRPPQTVEGGDRTPETIGGKELTPSA